MSVTDLEEYKLRQSPHMSGAIVCMACKHEWVGVTPAGAQDMECPKCGLGRGVHKYPLLPEHGIVWACGCGNIQFFITQNMNALCPSCGRLQRIE